MGLLSKLFGKESFDFPVQPRLSAHDQVMLQYSHELQTACRVALITLEGRGNTDVLKDRLKQLLSSLEQDLEATKK